MSLGALLVLAWMGAPWPPPPADDGAPPYVAPPPAPPPVVPEPPPRRLALPRWVFGGSFGIGAGMPSEQRRLYRKEVLMGGEALLSFGVARRVSRDTALGLHVVWAETASSGQSTAAPLVRRSFHWTVQAPLFFPLGPGFFVVPRAGVVTGFASFHGSPRAQLGPSFGLSVDVTLFGGVGPGLWVITAPTGKAGASGRPDDYGSVGVQLGGFLGG